MVSTGGREGVLSLERSVPEGLHPESSVQENSAGVEQSRLDLPITTSTRESKKQRLGWKRLEANLSGQARLLSSLPNCHCSLTVTRVA